MEDDPSPWAYNYMAHLARTLVLGCGPALPLIVIWKLNYWIENTFLCLSVTLSLKKKNRFIILTKKKILIDVITIQNKWYVSKSGGCGI